MAECKWFRQIKIQCLTRNLARYFTVRRRGRLMRGYFLISALLVIGGLVTSGAVEIYFSYIESREQLALVQKEIAAGAAGRSNASGRDRRGRDGTDGRDRRGRT